jgi:hypothetical protein
MALRKIITIFLFMPFAVALAAAPDALPLFDRLSAAEIVEKNVSIRGGSQAWRVVQAVSITGKMDAGGNNRPTQPVPARKSLIDPENGVKLVVASLEKVCALRQSSTPKAGKSYWMAFSNTGRLLKRGDHVDVVISAV